MHLNIPVFGSIENNCLLIQINLFIAGAGDSGSARPPKKRLANMTMPSLEELRRDSMNYRKKVISQFNDDTAKPKKKEKSKREKGKHKKKKEKVKDKDKDKHKVEIVSNETTSSKLIIRFARSKAEINPSNDSADEASTSNASYSINPSSSSSPPPMTAPIRLKIARSSQGGAYVAESTSTATATATTSKESAPKDADLTKCKVILTDFTKTNDLKSNDTDKSASQRQQTTSDQQSMNGNNNNNRIKFISLKSMTQHVSNLSLCRQLRFVLTCRILRIKLQ